MTTFVVSTVIKIANGAIKTLQADLDDYDKRLAAYRAKHLEEWQRDNLPKIRKLRDALTVALKTGKPIGPHHTLKLDGLLYTAPSTGSYGAERAVGYPANGTRQKVLEKIDELKVIVATLEAQTDETISANQLKLVGITKIGEMFRAAATVKEPK